MCQNGTILHIVGLNVHFFWTFKTTISWYLEEYGKSGHTFLRLLYSREKIRIFSALAVPKLCSLSERHRSRQQRGSERSPPKKIVKWGRKCAPCPLRRGAACAVGGLSPLASVENGGSFVARLEVRCRRQLAGALRASLRFQPSQFPPQPAGAFFIFILFYVAYRRFFLFFGVRSAQFLKKSLSSHSSVSLF